MLYTISKTYTNVIHTFVYLKHKLKLKTQIKQMSIWFTRYHKYENASYNLNITEFPYKIQRIQKVQMKIVTN
jgi:hypothetical protein